MAPSHGMLSHLRFHRNSSSPALDLSSPSSLFSQQSPFTPNGPSPSDGSPSSGDVPSLPPVLPPITRVTSTSFDLDPGERQDAKSSPSDVRPSPSDFRPSPSDVRPSPSDVRPSQASRSSYSAVSGFIGGVAFRKHRRDASAQQSPAVESSSDDLVKIKGPRPTSIPADAYARPPMRTLNSPKSTSLLNISSGNRNSSTTSLRPTNSRLSNETPPSLSIVTNAEPQKGKKGLPFLKNPMSTLLLRRKANQVAKAKLPLTLNSGAEESSFDPRIKGTRVHDFSAPRRKSSVPATSIPTTYSTSQLNLLLETRLQHGQGSKAPEAPQETSRRMSNASGSARLSPGDTVSLVLKSYSVSSVGTKSESDRLAPSARTKDADGVSTTHASIRTTRSGKLSLSSVPRHMRSTSSRFSFDMIGSTNQEKLLEERHRQRELDKKAAAASGGRNSIYDEYDDDGYDYEAMMIDDGGLEERIPGVNADYDDYVEDDGFYDEDQIDAEADPDNDQENFAGFAFQRSNPGSSAVRSSGPRNSLLDQESPGGYEGHGFTPPNATPPDSQEYRHSQDLNTEMPSQPAQVGRGFTVEDLYYGGGLTGFEDEFAEDLAAEPEADGVPFDESIFDDNDTDQFGRPVPGAFALAQSRRRAAHQQSSKRPSFMASKSSAAPILPGLIAHGEGDGEEEDEAVENGGAGAHNTGERKEIDEGAELQQEEQVEEKACASEHGMTDDDRGPATSSVPASSDRDMVALYQAALAAAAQEAAVSGKFERSVSPRKGEPDDPSDLLGDVDALDIQGYDASDDGGYLDDGIADDYELDDDAIIAEANASALASDADGWYGQEFGFYSAPINIHGSQNERMEAGGYANGGFFGPKGLSPLDLSTAGWVASREPNLTPITERSEYSNRNSFMSLGMANGSSGTPTLQSAGLAQLAMMADRGDDMTLSALLRLRSKAWGDSSASLASSRDGSPRSERGESPCSPRASHFAGSPLGSNGMHARKTSVFSIVSRDSDGISLPASPGLKVAIPSLPTPTPLAREVVGPDGCVTDTSTSTLPSNSEEMFPCPTWAAPPSAREGLPKSATTRDSQDFPASSASPSRPSSLGFPPGGSSPVASFAPRGHKRQQQSAESISYRQEEECGETRWVMERRRTGEFGQVEVVEREVLEGGRI